PRNGSGNSQFRAAPPVVRRIGMDRRATRPTWSDNLAHAEMMQARKWLSQIPRPAQYYGIDLRRSETRLVSTPWWGTDICCFAARMASRNASFERAVVTALASFCRGSDGRLNCRQAGRKMFV